MEKIANVQDLKPGKPVNFKYDGGKAILMKTPNGDLVAYSIVCPHAAGTIEWDARLQKLICGCHLSMFNVEDGSVYRYSSHFEEMANLTRIALNIDDNQDVYVI